ncbi:hypothetical protein NC653_007863 [Populus alba x Populus x berolinensis]|uniref:Uncharacterized protein n=1 Tax=Populus alba x Populus x berolinensis TaxID=444605 RepID=A0AAD6R5D1_9ROSI|nr:hypothetical protein NC653_007843 [Populus alba x Populus x berolinensis]KAJ7002486.1 hypothetical protein NC653_007845 [Populus alba x Populus x berolinensis]KAJ7002507.1 hypothetical protein NC653_007863 [Populus alba x Populus x berolinensis]
MSTIDVEKRLLANALLDFSNEWFLLLLESCIPLYKFHDHLCGVFYELSSDGCGHYFHQMLLEIQLHQWRKGSQWLAIQRDLAIYIVSETKYHVSRTKNTSSPQGEEIATFQRDEPKLKWVGILWIKPSSETKREWEGSGFQPATTSDEVASSKSLSLSCIGDHLVSFPGNPSCGSGTGPTVFVLCKMSSTDSRLLNYNASVLIRITPPLGSYCDCLSWIGTASTDVTILENSCRIAENEINRACYVAVCEELTNAAKSDSTRSATAWYLEAPAVFWKVMSLARNPLPTTAARFIKMSH